MKILIVVGTRPNFIKAAPLIKALGARSIDYKLLHTGQHYDINMSDIFFEDFKLKKPDWYLEVGPASQTVQTAKIMEGFEKICEEERPDLVIGIGDVTSTLACALVVSKIPGIKLAHIESGGRSFDRTIPEEINRIIVDNLSDYLFVIEPEHAVNLLRENIDKDKIFLVGDIIIDNLLHTIKGIDRNDKHKKYGLVTLHRQVNTDNVDRLRSILTALDELSKNIKIKFPIHPRTKNIISRNGLVHLLKNIDVLDPLGYFDFTKQMYLSEVLITDSGGATIEAAVLGIPCVVLRDRLERTFLVEEKMSVLVDSDTNRIIEEVNTSIKNGLVKLNSKWDDLLDGKTAERIIDILFGGIDV